MSRPSVFLLTGTDTGVGKTTVGCALAAALADRGIRVGVAKPFETGCQSGTGGELIPADGERLRYFAGCDEPLHAVCPVRCREPLAPAVALRREKRTVDMAKLRATIEGVVSRHEITLVEGAGGLLVPVARAATFASLARSWKLPVILVVGNRLGALNHAQLTVRCAEQARLTLAGYIVNTLGPETDLAAETNVEALTELLGPPLGVLPWLGEVKCTPEDRARLARAAERHIDLGALSTLTAAAVPRRRRPGTRS